MAIDPPKFPQAQCVLTFTAPVLREASRDEVIIAGLANEFPNVISRPMGQSVAPNASLVLASGSSQLSIGPGQADFAVGFYGGHLTSLGGVMGYLRTKLGTVVSTLNGVGVNVLVAGVVLAAQFSFGTDEGAMEGVLRHLLDSQIRQDVPVDDVADVQVRLGLKVSNTYYVSLLVNNYESRSFQRIALPATPIVAIRPWEGDVTDLGVQLIIDVNNRLEARQAETDRPLDESRLGDILDALAAVAAETGPRFVETGHISSAEIEATLGAAQ